MFWVVKLIFVLMELFKIILQVKSLGTVSHGTRMVGQKED